MSPLGWMESCKPLPSQRQMVPGLRLTQVLSSADSYCELTPCWRQSSTKHNARLVLTFFLPLLPWCCPLHLEAVACYHACWWDSTTWMFVVSTRRSRCREDSLPMAPLVVYAMRCWKTESSFLTPSVSRSWTVQSARWRKQNSRHRYHQPSFLLPFFSTSGDLKQRDANFCFPWMSKMFYNCAYMCPGHQPMLKTRKSCPITNPIMQPNCLDSKRFLLYPFPPIGRSPRSQAWRSTLGTAERQSHEIRSFASIPRHFPDCQSIFFLDASYPAVTHLVSR